MDCRPLAGCGRGQSFPPPRAHPRPALRSYHEGDPADSRMSATARSRGITLTSRSRPLNPADLAEVRVWADLSRRAGWLLRLSCGAFPGGAARPVACLHPRVLLFFPPRPPPPAPHPRRPPPRPQFDYIVGMDASNVAAIQRAAEHWRGASHGSPVPAHYPAKLSLMTDYLRSAQFAGKYREVPDP